MEKAPLKIGISACFFYPDVNRRVYGKKTLIYSEKDMMNWVMSEGHFPILIPPATKNFPMDRWVDFLDGLILMGGDDLSPKSYGEEPLKPEWAGDYERDLYEIELYNTAKKKKIPILGICRGAQLINVAHGGRLIQDIPSQKPESVPHRDPVIYDQLFHEV